MLTTVMRVSGRWHVGIAGAGPSGSVIARQLAEAGHNVTVFDARDHVAGNCHTSRDENGVLLHRYGPHIFHTADEGVWAYVTRFAEMMPYEHRVFTTTRSGVFSMPVNLLTLNQLLGTTMSPAEAQNFLARSRLEAGRQPDTFLEAALAAVGEQVFEEFFRGYTEKQWGRDTSDLPASVFGRLPVRTDYRSSYFSHPHQGIPRAGYTELVERILDHPGIEVQLSTPVSRNDLDNFDHAVWTGPIDAYFDFVAGDLPYRTLDFEVERHLGDFQGCPVMNYAERSVPFTRITEHKHFAPWEEHEGTTIYREFSREFTRGNVPYYPVRLASGQSMLDEYVDLARGAKVTFAGRLGTYRYIDMDVTIREAIDTASAIEVAIEAGSTPPSFGVSITG